MFSIKRTLRVLIHLIVHSHDEAHLGELIHDFRNELFRQPVSSVIENLIDFIDWISANVPCMILLFE